MMIANAIFTYRKNVLTDGSVIWEVWQRGADARTASAATEMEADRLIHNLNTVVDAWAYRTADNTVDC